MYNEVGLSIAIILLFLFLYMAVLAIAVLNYVFTAKAMYRLSVRRNIPYPWMAWVPMLNSWNLGSVVNEYDQRLGMKRKWNLLIVILYGVFFVVYTMLFVFLFVFILRLAIIGEYVEFSDVIGPFIMFYIAILAMVMVSMAIGVINAICTYKVFESTVPDKAVKYLLLSLFIPLARAVCMLKCTNMGYPFPSVREPETATE